MLAFGVQGSSYVVFLVFLLSIAELRYEFPNPYECHSWFPHEIGQEILVFTDYTILKESSNMKAFGTRKKKELSRSSHAWFVRPAVWISVIYKKKRNQLWGCSRILRLFWKKTLRVKTSKYIVVVGTWTRYTKTNSKKQDWIAAEACWTVNLNMLEISQFLGYDCPTAESCSTIFINRIPDQSFGRGCSRFDHTLKGNGLPVLKMMVRPNLPLVQYLRSYESIPLVNSGLSGMTVSWSSTGGLMS